MKVDLNAAFSQVQRFLRVGSTVAPPREFAETLASKLEHSQQIQTKQALGIPNQDELKSNSKGIMASFKPELPELIAPVIEKIKINSDLTEDLKPQSGVNELTPPKLLDVRRVPSTEAMSRMQQNERISAVRGILNDSALQHGIDPVLSMAVISAESSFNPTAVSSDGHASKGLFQLLDTTGNYLFKNAGLKNSYDPFNPGLNIELGVGYLRKLHEMFSVQTELPNNLSTYPAANSSSLEKLAVAAFNAGEGRVASAQKRAKEAGMDPTFYDQIEAYLPKSTQEYVKRVLESKPDFEEPFIG